jgi:Icc-related predicted phosphoesterase
MRILAFTDLHDHMPFFIKLKKKAEQADIIICAGDMTIFERGIAKVIAKIASLGKETYIIHGNHEEAVNVRNECAKHKNLHFCHKRVFRMNGISIFGYGGGGFSYVDRGFEQFMESFKYALQKKNILVTHAPAYGTGVDMVMGEHAGNRSIRKYVKCFNLAVSGHLHEANGRKQVIGKTLLINPGPEGRLIEV